MIVTALLTALLPALLAGLVAVGVTLAVERWGGVVGGLVGTLPSTIVPAALGIHAGAVSHEAFIDAMMAVPPGMLLNVGFLYLWRVLPPRLPPWSLRARLGLMAALSLGAWFVGALVVVRGEGWLVAAGVSLRGVAVAVTILMVLVGVLACWTPRPAPRGRRRVRRSALVLRGTLAAGAIAVAVIIARSGGGVAAGVASVFPAIFFTAMFSLWLAQGEAVPAGAVGPMMLGAGSVAVFALLAAAALPTLGLGLGLAAAWAGAVCVVTVPAWVWMQRRAAVPQ